MIKNMDGEYMAKKRRIKSLDEHYMGPEPDFRKDPPPTDKKQRQTAYSKATHWYYYFTNKKLYTKEVIAYCKDVLKFSKKEIQAMKCLPDWKVYMKFHAFVKMTEIGWDFTQEQIDGYHEKLREVLLPEGLILLKNKKEEKDSKPKKEIISPHERTRRKVLATIVGDWDEMVIDKWMDGKFDKKEVKFPTYQLFQLHSLKGSAINIFKDIIMQEYEPVKDAYDRTCDQAMEAYAHIKKGDKKKMLVLMEGVFEELDRVRDSLKSARTANKKPKSKESQVKNLKYLQDDVDAKLVSIHPALIPSQGKLWMFNVKTRKLTEFITSSTEGFEIRGSTLQRWDDERSRITTLRKPDEVLPQILNKTERQIDNLWKTFTTKIGKPTGRINKDTILLRVESYKR